MAESKIKDENYYQISGFMINRLGLKGIALNVYAIIYGFSQDGESEFTGSLQYLCDFCGGVSKPTIIHALKALTEAGYIIRREEVINGVKFNRYKSNLPIIKNLNGGKEILTGGLKNLNGGSKEFLPNNKTTNNIYNEVEEEYTPDPDDPEIINNKLQVLKGNIILSENQIGNLLDIMGLEIFDEYCDRLRRFIENKNVVVKSHYATILKWYKEDCAVKA
jgi:DNA-binding transcriptional ArsR family regulator